MTGEVRCVDAPDFLCLKKKMLDLELTPRCIVALSEVKSMTIKEVCEKYTIIGLKVMKNWR